MAKFKNNKETSSESTNATTTEAPSQQEAAAENAQTSTGGETATPQSAGEQQSGQEQQAARGNGQQVQVDESNLQASYANFCRVQSTPEELILDLGLNPNPYNPNGTPVKVAQRVILNHYTAKRMLNALSMALQRHEQAFGVLETDVRRRIRQ